MTKSQVKPSELDAILHTFAEDLIAYDQRMTAAGAPPIRFVHKYSKKAKAAITALITSERTKAYDAMEGIVGKDAPILFKNAAQDIANEEANRLRAEQRKALAQLRSKD